MRLTTRPAAAIDEARVISLQSSRLLRHKSFDQSQESYALPPTSLSDLYGAYIDCLNRRDLAQLGCYVDDQVQHNDRPLMLSGYRDMLLKGFQEIPDLRFNIQLLVCEPPCIAARLAFECSPKGEFLGISINGRTVSFTENVIYKFKDAKIAAVWSVIDKTAIEAQLS